MGGIGKKVDLFVLFDAFAQKFHTVLHNDRIILHAMYKHQLSVKLIHMVKHVRVFIAFRVFLWHVHVAFAVHYFVHFPIDDRATSNANFKHIRVAQHEVKGHKTAETPAMYANAVCVNIRKFFQICYPLHLVVCFGNPQLAVNYLFKSLPAIGRAAIIEGESDVAFFGHIIRPQTGIV